MFTLRSGLVSMFLHQLKHLCACVCEGGEKRKSSEPLSHEDTKKARVMGDIPMELINEVMSTITDPAVMLGPEVHSLWALFCMWLMLLKEA